MILTEQQYKNLYRNYFHGSRTGKIEKKESFYDYFYLTNNFVYAALYACQEDPLIGKVYRYTLKEGLNIFNAYSKKDVEKLRLYFFKNKIPIDKNWYWSGLEKEDWNCIFRGNQKDLFIKAIKDCNFDGFFNYEWTEKYKKEFEVIKGEKIPTSPAIGVFNIEKLIQREVLEYKDYFNNEDFKKAHEDEKNNLINKVIKSKERRRDFYQDAVFFIQNEATFLTENDLNYVIENIDNFKNGVNYERNLYEDAIYKKLQEKGICFGERGGSWVLTRENEIKCFRSVKDLQKISENCKLKNFKNDYIKNYEECRRDRSFYV